MANELVEYDKACRALARAASVDEVLAIRDTAIRIQLYAKQAKNKKAEADAWDIRTRAERKLGVEMEERKLLRAGVGRQKVSDNPLPTLEANGVDKNLANRARRLGELSETDFGKYRIDGRNQIERHVEKEIRKKSKPKLKKPKPTRELKCPHCGKAVYLQGGKLEK